MCVCVSEEGSGRGIAFINLTDVLESWSFVAFPVCVCVFARKIHGCRSIVTDYTYKKNDDTFFPLTT